MACTQDKRWTKNVNFDASGTKDGEQLSKNTSKKGGGLTWIR